MMKRRFRIVVTILLFLIAVGMTVYPYIANFVFEHRNDSLVNTIEQSVNESDEAKIRQILGDAHTYNKVLSESHVQLRDPFETESEELNEANYNSVLNANGDGIMGLVEIPSIDVKLPIYHTTDMEVLEKGVGHLEGTSLPVGGENTNCVLTGHTGLSNAKLFTDLTSVKKDDIFILTVMGEKLAYKVENIMVVLPNELDDLYPIKGKDLCTLVTCTPYGVNTHRLLVQGVRIDYQDVVSDPVVLQRKNVESKWMAEYKRALLISAGCFVAGLVVFLGINIFIKQKHSDGRTK